MTGAAKAETVAGVLAPAHADDPKFASADELREVLDRLLSAVNDDPEAGPRLRGSKVPHRFRYPDLDVVLNVSGSEEEGVCLQWAFTDDVPWAPQLTFEMDSTVANRYLQGEENLAIALARRRIRLSGFRARAALEFLPASSRLLSHYRRIVADSYPHLKLG